MDSSSVSRAPQFGMMMRCLAWGILGVVAAECFVRLVVPFSLFYNTWFEGGIHQPDEELGFVYTPNYVGGMRHREQTWRVPLELDENGFRLPVSTDDDSDTPSKDVVLLGGVSMMFSYGLRDDQTIAAHIAKNSVVSVRVHTLSQPGFKIGRDFYKFKRYFEGRLRPSVVVVSLYGPNAAGELLAEYSSTPSKPAGDPFRFHDGIAIKRPGLPHRIGRPFLQSYVIAGGCRLIDKVDTKLYRLKDLVTGRQPKSENQTSERTDPDETQIRRYQNDLLSNMQEFFERRDVKLIFVFLPKHGTPSQLATTNLTSRLLDHDAVLDLTGSLRVADSDWKAAGHYGPRSARIVGARIADAIQPLLDEAPHDNNEKRRLD
jgi:hypothetical protein